MHERVECSQCKKVIMTCRCMEAHNNIRYEVCVSCRRTPSEPLTQQELKLAIALFNRAADEFGNHGCNDLPREVQTLLSRNEWNELNLKFHQYNGDPEEYREGYVMQNDSAWMNYLVARLQQVLNNLNQGISVETQYNTNS